MNKLTASELNIVLSHKGRLNHLSVELRDKLIKAIIHDENPFDSYDDDVCCDFGLGPRDRFKKTSADDCTQLNGTIVDNSNCPL